MHAQDLNYLLQASKESMSQLEGGMVTIIQVFHKYSGHKCKLRKAELKALINNEMGNFIKVSYSVKTGIFMAALDTVMLVITQNNNLYWLNEHMLLLWVVLDNNVLQLNMCWHKLVSWILLEYIQKYRRKILLVGPFISRLSVQPWSINNNQ